MASDKILKDGKLHVYLIGSGGPINNNTRVAPCIAVMCAGEFFLFDVGPGSYRNVDLMRLPTSYLSAIFLTHFHSDHIGDLGEANMHSSANGRTKPLDIYGPEGVEKVVNGFIMAYEQDSKYRNDHHGDDIFNLETATPISKTIKLQDPNERELVFDKEGLKVYAFEVDHTPVIPALGYRIEYKGNVVVITGDTIKTENLVKHSKNADILFSEAISFDMIDNAIVGLKRQNVTRGVKIMTDIKDYHMSPVIAAELAKEANVKKLVYTHVVPPVPNEKIEQMFLKGVSDVFTGEVVLGKDMMKFRLASKE